MSIFRAWKAWRQFRKLPVEWRSLVFYSETGQDWHQFSGLIEELNQEYGRKVCYVTSDPDDAGLSRQHENYLAICIPEGLYLTVFFQVNQADVFVLTMMDLGNLQLKRSLHPVYYVYLFHSMGSTHMVDHANSFDHYESLFCAGPHQVAEIRKREELYKLPAKQLFDYGHPRLEQVINDGNTWREKHGPSDDRSALRKPVILIAPTWGDTSIFNVCGEALIEVLLNADFKVIMRPHYQSNKLSPKAIDAIRNKFSGNPNFEYMDQMGETESILRSDVLISDWSAMALEYSLGLEKPVLFIDVPRRIRNPDWRELDLEPVESSIRQEVGAVISPDHLETVPESIMTLINSHPAFSERVDTLREKIVFRVGSSVQAGAAELAKLADQQEIRRKERNENHA
jgi:CDP-glycerol glycerophosphotransferase (TagB/SpsB family)